MIDPEELAMTAGMLMPFFVAVQGSVGEEAIIDVLLPAPLEVDDLRGFEFAVARWSDGIGLEVGRIAMEHVRSDIVVGEPGASSRSAVFPASSRMCCHSSMGSRRSWKRRL